ncbi:MAG: NAD-dependent epimerase/dehydratase family protein [Campylobacteraceae bacterium]|nr:NAD-dependent epimerase/dehydratase family protein [Campylobacteraceae bacterium]
MNKKILILGASGLLGQSLVDLFKEKEYVIGALSRNSLEYTDKNINIYNIDILDYLLLEEVIKEYDIIVNCTGQITNPINQCLLLNTSGITNIINAVEKYNKKFIHISSVSVYGSTEYASEVSKLNPETPYATMKYFSDYLIEQRLKNYAILRVSNLFGKNQQKGIINYLTKSYLNNTYKLDFNNNGTLKRYYLHIEDFVSTIDKIIQKDIKGIYNIIGTDQLTIKELVLMFEVILNIKFNIDYTDDISLENIENIDCNKINTQILLDYKINVEKYIKGLKS